ncbi:hypothetical protein ACSHT0_04655 [Tepidicaulis sp. LMO-SS28]|uniref:hypothetical protein n=1 Tax=Tepidicaulis sp. LMO-SS28 TaxID=3447455 RepID=UPI003EE0AC4F
MTYSKRRKSLTVGAQIAQMRNSWPGFAFFKGPDGLLLWKGILRPLSREYLVDVLWRPDDEDMPYVFLDTPELVPRMGAEYEDIPHLIFNSAQPSRSALCLFDGESAEWLPSLSIAKTIVPWASEWLMYYEMWLADGVWRGGGIELETISPEHERALHGQARA